LIIPIGIDMDISRSRDVQVSRVNPVEENSKSSKSVSPLTQDVEIADIGCGFGGLLIALAPRLPKTLILGTLLMWFYIIFYG